MASGGFAQVWKGELRGRDVALKVFHGFDHGVLDPEEKRVWPVGLYDRNKLIPISTLRL